SAKSRKGSARSVKSTDFNVSSIILAACSIYLWGECRLSGATQAPVRGTALVLRLVRRLSLPMAISLLAGCSMSALDLQRPGVDRSTITGSIAPVPEGESPQIPRPADLPTGTEAMLRAMVSAMGEGSAQTLPLSWADPENGVRGVVSQIDEDETGTCRRFMTTRESFDGISLYRGTVCPNPEIGWRIQVFEAV
ncbi:RT0821/Lpp0805 family surface protein, partial [uncultured Nitratireductor sp.]|uniref:RT0821/Lpp0805 family surface protein n=1 Tax=uncultured Nitratireductor sp. TaxID=520953 RepID=UPI0025F3C821